MLTLWTVNYVPGKDPLERFPAGVSHLERPLESSKLKFKGSFQVICPHRRKGAFPVTSLTVHSVCFFLALNGKSRVFLQRQIWIVNYYIRSQSKNLSNENINTGVSVVFKTKRKLKCQNKLFFWKRQFFRFHY